MKHKDKIIELHKEGKSYSQISAELGCSKGTIAYHVGVGVKDRKSAKQRDRRNKIRKYIQQYKQDAGCTDCKEDYPYYMLDFDHRPDEQKLFNISSWSNRSGFDEVVKEISKCDVVCANCHRIRTYQRLDKSGESVLDLSQQY